MCAHGHSQSRSPAPHMVTQTEEVETIQNCIQQLHTWEAHAVDNGVRLLLPVFGLVELFVSPGCKTPLATKWCCHLGILSFLSRMFKFKPQTCGWQRIGENKEPNNLLSAPECPACDSYPSCPRGMVEYRGNVSRACQRFKLLRLTRQNLKNPTDNKCTEIFRLCSLLYRVCCFMRRRKTELTHSCTKHLGLEEHSLTASEPLFATLPSPNPLFDTSASTGGSPHPLPRLLSAVCAPEV